MLTTAIRGVINYGSACLREPLGEISFISLMEYSEKMEIHTKV